MTQTLLDKLEGLRYQVRQRMEFIRKHACSKGYINRNDIADEFGMSTQQASADIALFNQITNDGLVYDKSKKLFQPSASLYDVKSFLKVTESTNGNNSFYEVHNQAKRYLQDNWKHVYPKFIRGTPLENDIAVWVAEFSINAVRNHQSSEASEITQALVSALREAMGLLRQSRFVLDNVLDDSYEPVIQKQIADIDKTLAKYESTIPTTQTKEGFMTVNMGKGLDPKYRWDETDNGTPNNEMIRLAMKPNGEHQPEWEYINAYFCTKSLQWIDADGGIVPSYPKTHFAYINEEGESTCKQ